ncbi:MAG TPA: FxDxF family PEP-CTERM protein [Burkholderiaceae bacterium]|nr:FxDxF family PEP-CTERM protein [Burkholderiaceae bacterium]
MRMKLLVAAAASAAAINAGAATTVDWGVHDPLELAAILADPGAISDTINFSISSTPNLPNTITYTAVANNLTSVLGVSNGMVELFRDNPGTTADSSLGSFSFDGTTGSTSHSFLSLVPGADYYYRITGTATGSHGGFYTLTSTVTPVPEPESYALMLAGLAVGASLYRRRKGN